MTNGQKKNTFARCDMCKDKNEADNGRIRQANKAMVVPSRIQPSLNTQTHMHEMVTIFCVCGHGKDVDINRLWDKNEKNRFQNIRCTSCKETSKLGKWLRRPHENDNSIEEWLRYNNALHKNQRRPDFMTVYLYVTQNTLAKKKVFKKKQGQYS